MLGYFDNSRNNGIGPIHTQPYATLPAKPAVSRARQLSAAAAREWNELPYAMMRLTPARRRFDDKPLFWQDQTLQLGDIDLDFTRIWLNDRSASYIATFRINETRRAVTQHPSPKAGQTHREFALHPSLEGDQLRWASSGVSESLKLNTNQLAEKLLGKLVTFYTRGLS